jgi:hypothetical protein
MIRARLLGWAIGLAVFLIGYWLFVVHGVHMEVRP